MPLPEGDEGMRSLLAGSGARKAARRYALESMPSSDDILAVLDVLAEEFMFPGFNNMNYETVDSRLHCLRDGDRWALVVEELVDWPGAGGLTLNVFVMGAARGERLWCKELIQPPLEFDEDDEDDEEVLIPEAVELRGMTVSIDRAGLDALVEQHEIEPTFALLVQLAESHRDALFSTTDELGERVEPGLQPILTLDDWAHPDVYGGPKPSESEAFRQLAEVLATGDVAAYSPTEPPNNRDWRMWLESR